MREEQPIVATIHAYSPGEAIVMLQAVAMRSAIDSFRERLRSLSKHQVGPLDPHKLYQEYLEEFEEFLS